jgi:hypothetical protein
MTVRAHVRVALIASSRLSCRVGNPGVTRWKVCATHRIVPQRRVERPVEMDVPVTDHGLASPPIG